jgi:uncharacterized membrane protein YhaH (DUF805 family)/type II secretory pathway pseudopilin PulG
MNDVASDIRFFDASSRIGRVRYLAYPWGILLIVLPVLIIGGLTFLVHMAFVGVLLFIAVEIFALVMGGVFIVRRLHDFGRSGWWSLIYWAIQTWSLYLTLHFLFTHPLGSPQPLGNYLPSLLLFTYFLVMVLVPGTQGANRFGSIPPPNSTWVLVGAWMWLVFILLGIVAGIGVAALSGSVGRGQATEAVQLARGAEAPLTQAYKTNKSWPADLAQVYPKAAQDPAGTFVEAVTGAPTSDGYAVVATLLNRNAVRPLAGKSVEIWTRDDGATWNCGPGGADPLDTKYLPADCRDGGAP